LYLSHRQTFTQNVDGSFGNLGFYNYMNGVNDIGNKDKLIIQIDSLKHLILCKEFKYYDIIILDECESLLNHLSSITIGENRTFICSLLNVLIKKAKIVLALDADLDERSFYFLKEIREKPQILINEYKSTIKRFMLTNNYNIRKFQINEDIKNGKNIVIICLSKTVLDDLYEYIIKNNKKCRIIRYSSMTDDSQKDKLKDVNTYWKEFQVVMYTPTIEAGLDFNQKNYFYRMYCFLCNGSCSPRSFLQMVGRIRNIDDNNIRCFYDKTMLFSDKNIYIPTLDEIEEIIINNVNRIPNYEIGVENDKITIKRKNIFTRLFAYNKLEEYQKDIKFIKVFKELVIIKGYTYIDDVLDTENKEEIQEEDKSKKSKESKGTISEYIEEPLVDIHKSLDTSTIITSKSIYELDELLKAPSINDNKMKELENKKNKNMATRIDKLCLKRYWMTKTFKIKDEEFNQEFLQTWYNKEYILFNALYAMNKKPAKKFEDVYFNKTEKRLEHLKKLLEVYGFKNIFDFDTIIIKDDKLVDKMKESKMIEYENYKIIISDFNKKIQKEGGKEKDGFAVNKFIVFSNCILYDFGVKLNSCKKQIRLNNKRLYKIEYQLYEDKQNIKKIINMY
jgi:hypothetical protein